jgi:hypothetical protein
LGRDSTVRKSVWPRVREAETDAMEEVEEEVERKDEEGEEGSVVLVVGKEGLDLEELLPFPFAWEAVPFFPFPLEEDEGRREGRLAIGSGSGCERMDSMKDWRRRLM